MINNKIIVAVSGTPGTGKSFISEKILERIKTRINAVRLDVTEFAKRERFYDYFDDEYDSYIVDSKKLKEAFVKFAFASDAELIILDGHMSHLLPREFVDFLIVMTCDISVLKKRLEDRNYSDSKIRENLDSEIMKVCLTEAEDLGHQLIEIDSSNPYSDDYRIVFEKCVSKICSLFENHS